MTNSKAFHLTKMHGTENDFLIGRLMSEEDRANFAALLGSSELKEFVIQQCDRTAGIGADGLLLLEPGTKADLKWTFLNSDGSDAEMCGNAARCVGLYAKERGLSGDNVTFETTAGIIKAEVLDNTLVKVDMTPVSEYKPEFRVQLNGDEIKGTFINTGVPHFVLHREADEKLASRLRSHPDFSPRGSNITFYTETSDNEINAISFERGVEGFTRSCGTGAVAAGFAHRNSPDSKSEIIVNVPGGKLKVLGTHVMPQLIGPAVFVDEVKFYL